MPTFEETGPFLKPLPPGIWRPYLYDCHGFHKGNTLAVYEGPVDAVPIATRPGIYRILYGPSFFFFTPLTRRPFREIGSEALQYIDGVPFAEVHTFDNYQQAQAWFHCQYLGGHIFTVDLDEYNSAKAGSA